MKLNKSWLNLSTKVCDECYLRYTDKIAESEYQSQIKESRINLLENISLKKLGVNNLNNINLNNNNKNSALQSNNALIDEGSNNTNSYRN